METQNPGERSPGAVWVWAGWLSLAATVLSWRLLGGRTRDDTFLVLPYGGFLSLVLLLIGLGRSIYSRRRRAEAEQTPPRGSRRGTVGFALAGLFCTAGGVGLWGIDHYHKVRQEAECLAEAQGAVEAYFEKKPHPRLGVFRNMTGEGYNYPSWNIQGYQFLSADRNANFAGGSVQIRMYVTEGSKTAPGVEGVGTPRVESSGPEQVSIYVSHSRLEE
jgi:hypothetical protein